jgi:hypothetical protein
LTFSYVFRTTIIFQNGFFEYFENWWVNGYNTQVDNQRVSVPHSKNPTKHRYSPWQMLDRQLLQTHFVWKFFLALKAKKERVFFVTFFLLQKLQFFAGKPILHWEKHHFRVSFFRNSLSINYIY